MSTDAMGRARRTYLLGKSRSSAIIGKSRKPGELILLGVGGLLGILAGLVLGWLPLRIIWPQSRRCSCRTGIAPSTAFEIDRTYRRLLRSGATWTSDAAEAGTRLDGAESEIASPQAWDGCAG